jgi:flagellar basal body rod protein FlgC
MSITGIAFSGLRASMTRLTASASNIANTRSTGPAPCKPVRAVQGEIAGGGVSARIEASGAADVDLTEEMLEMLVGRLAFQANAQLLEAVHQIDRRALNTLE